MAQPRSWVNEVFDVLAELGGQGTLSAIYARIVQRNRMNLESNNWQMVVRKTIQEHSSDALFFHTMKKTEEDDLFFAPKGMGAGFWAIREIHLRPIKDLLSAKVEEGVLIEGYEGTKKQRFVNTYERDINLRKAAIKFHGTTCKGCHFNFEAFYGEHGADYIEVHHLRPISSYGGSIVVHPQADMTVLCANCHRMVHRDHEHVLSLEELQVLVKAHQK
jgi:predicted HNH restriction endonuclease